MEATEDRDDDVRATLGALIAESEALLAAIGDEGAQRYQDAAAALQRQIRNARDRVEDLHYATARTARIAARHADRYVQDNPWRTAGAAVAIGAAVGALVALLIVRSTDSGSD
jgi:ElaB/YqjD/DUF883 family membrane-anchored ribosome-binding protein